MGYSLQMKTGQRNEIVSQIAYHILVFVALTVTRKDPTIEWSEVAVFMNYTVSALFISYWALPRFNKNENAFALFIYFVLALLFCILVEELLIEKYFFPEERGQNIVIFWALLSALPKLSLLIAFKLVWDIIFIRKELDEVKSVARQNELQFLQSQINPHFLFNNLNNIYSYSLDNSPKTPEIILGLSDLLRYVLYDCKEEYMSLDKELKQLESFIKLSEVQIENRGEVNFKFPTNTASYKIAPLLLLVFVENAFKHSASSMSEGIQISVVANITDTDKLEFICSNTYSSNSNVNSLSKGIGLANVRKRLELIYGDQYYLDIKSDNNIYTASLLIPLHHSNYNMSTN